MSQQEKSSVLEMVAEFLRELAVLVFVFVPLELWKDAQRTRHELIADLIWTAILALASLSFGIALERKRPS